MCVLLQMLCTAVCVKTERDDSMICAVKGAVHGGVCEEEL